MTLPSTGSLSMSQINIEIGKASNAAISMNDAAVRSLAGKASGAISFADLRGKSYALQSVSLSKTSVSGSCTGSTSCTATTEAVTATPVGGGGPYSYAWEYVSGSTFTVSAPTSATTTFSVNRSFPQGEITSASGVYRCKVTDGRGNVRYSANVSLSTNHASDWVGGGGGGGTTPPPGGGGGGGGWNPGDPHPV